MKRFLLSFIVVAASAFLVQPSMVEAHNFGDFRSETLTTKAWKALEDGDIEGVLAFTNKCIELYAGQARKQQDSLSEYVEGPDDAVFANWALNDVATSLFIQGEAYRKAEMKDEAKAAYQKIVSKYTYGQTWDTGGWFWKPAEAAKEKMAMIDSGSILDFGDYSSSHLTTQAWKALNSDDFDSVAVYVDKVIELYDSKAVEMQASLTEYPWESKDKIFSFWALNDVGTSLFISAEANKKQGKSTEAKSAYKKLVDEYFYAQCWDPNGWFWKPAEAAQQSLDELGEI